MFRYVCVRGAALLLVLSANDIALAQTESRVDVPGRGGSSFAVTYQQIKITERELVVLRENFGEITLRSAYFEFDRGLTDRLALTVTLPLKSNRYVGDKPHDPTLLRNDHGEQLLDDGRFHTNFGDLGVNLRWLWRSTGRTAITPFVGFYTPSNDYPLYTETQAGRGQWRLDLGFNAAGRLGPPRLNLQWQAGYAYSFMEETRPSDAPARRVNSSQVTLELGWRATPRLMPYVTVGYYTTHHGLQLTEFVDPFVSDQFYYHDQLLPWEQTTWAAGTRYSLSDRVGLYFSFGRSAHVEFGHFYEPAFSFGFNRSLPPHRARTR
jgi:hypothetical protein